MLRRAQAPHTWAVPDRNPARCACFPDDEGTTAPLVRWPPFATTACECRSKMPPHSGQRRCTNTIRRGRPPRVRSPWPVSGSPKGQPRHSRPWQASWTVRAEPSPGCTGVEPSPGYTFSTEPSPGCGFVFVQSPRRGALPQSPRWAVGGVQPSLGCTSTEPLAGGVEKRHSSSSSYSSLLAHPPRSLAQHSSSSSSVYFSLLTFFLVWVIFSVLFYFSSSGDILRRALAGLHTHKISNGFRGAHNALWRGGSLPLCPGGGAD